MPKMKSQNPMEKSQYEIAMKPENFFPYGGGGSICTGRFFAKQEIMAAIAMVVVKFEAEGKGWVTNEGRATVGPAMPAKGYDGLGVCECSSSTTDNSVL